MTDIVDSGTRARMMAGIRGKNTRPELMVRRYLHAVGLRFRVHAKTLPGSPDIVLAKYRVAIFVHGCFWHRHEGCAKATTPSSRVDFWASKFAGNMARDRRNLEALLESGWTALTIWECETSSEEALEGLFWQIVSARSGSA